MGAWGRAVWRAALQATRSTTRELREGRGYAPGPLVADSTRRDASLQPFSRSATVLAQERCSAVVMQSCGCQRPETIFVIRVVRGFEHGHAALAVQRDGAQIANRGGPAGRIIGELMQRVRRHGIRTR